MQDAHHLIVIPLFHLLHGQPAIFNFRNQINGLNSIALQTYLLFKYCSRLSRHTLFFLVGKSKQIGHT